MKFGIRLIEYVGGARALIELAVLAEKAGFDYVWFPHDPFMKHTWVMTTAVAEHTKRIKIGAVAVNPYTTDPWEIASYVATLDELSGGRAVIGLGVHTGEMIEWCGIDAANYIARTREAVAIVEALLRGEVVDTQGEEFRWSDQCYLRFKPLRCEIPIYVAAFGPEFLALSGEIGQGSLPMITPPESAGYMVEMITKGAKRAGRDMSEIDISGCAWLSLSQDANAARDHLRPMIAYFGPYMEAPSLAAIGLAAGDFKAIKQLGAENRHEEAAAAVTGDMFRLAIAGTPKEVIGRIEYLARAGITQVNLGGPLGPDPAAAIRLMGERVIPHFR